MAEVQDYLDMMAEEAPPAPAGMRPSLSAAVLVDPDAEAGTQALARRTGLPAAVVETNRDEARRKDVLGGIDFDAYEALSPGTSRFLSNLPDAKIAHDDIENMAQIEKLSQGFSVSSPRGAPSSPGSIMRGLLESLRTAGVNIRTGLEAQFAYDQPFPGMAPIRERQQREVEQVLNSPEFHSPTARMLYGGLQNLISNTIPGVAVAVATRNPVAGLGVAGVQVETEAYGRYAERGATRQEAALGALGETAIEAATELAPLSYIAERFGKETTRKLVGEWLLKEGVGEQIATAGQDAVDTAIANPGKTWADYRGERLDAAAQTAISTLVSGGFFGAANQIAYRMSGYEEDAQRAGANAEVQRQVDDLAAASRVRQRDPEAFRRFLENVETPVTDIYVDPLALAQAGLTPEQMETVAPGSGRLMAEAVETGNDIRIPIKEYQANIAGTELGAALLDHIKVNPTDLSAAEAKTFYQEQGERFQAEVDSLLTTHEEQATFRRSSDVVYEDLLGQLRGTGRFTDDVNEPNARLVTNFIDVLAARHGMTPEQFFQQYPLKIEGVPIDVGFSQPGNAEAAYRTELISSQEYLDDDIVQQKREAKDYEVMVSPEFKFNGRTVQVVLDGHHSYAAAIADGVEPEITVATPREDDRVAILEEGEGRGSRKRRIDDFLTATYTDSRWRTLRPASPGKLKQATPTSNLGAYSPNTRTISLLQASNLSTFLHEAGHYFLDVMGQAALQPNAPSLVLADLDTTFRWLGLNGGAAEWGHMTLNEQRPHHEKFARAFEAYLFTGKAPSADLRGVFQRFRAWLVQVYGSLKSFASRYKVELAPEITGVFDRMLASTEDIAAMEESRGFEKLFRDATEAGMTPEEFQEYQSLGSAATEAAIEQLQARSLRDMKWLTNARSRAIREMQADAVARRRVIHREVTEAVMSEPVNRARQFMRRGKLPGVVSAERHRMDTNMLKALVGEERHAEIVGKLEGKYGKYGLLGADGLHPDTLAEMFGFPSPDALIDALLNAENARDKIEGLTNQRMLERYGDLATPEDIARAADEAVHHDARLRFVATELNALQKLTGGRKIMAGAAREYSREKVWRTKVRDLRPGAYVAAGRRAAREAEKARAAGDLRAAALHKRNHLINAYGTKATYEAQNAVERILRHLKKFDREGVRKSVDPDYLDQIDALLARFDLRRGVSLRDLDRRASFAEWLGKQREEGLEPDIDPKLLNEAFTRHYKDATVEELQGLDDAIRQIEHMGRLKHKLLTAKDKRDFEAARDLIADAIRDNARGKVSNITQPGTLDPKLIGRQFLAVHRKMANAARQMDGSTDGGPVWEYFVRSMNSAGDKESEMRAKATERLSGILEPVLALGPMGGKGIFFPSIQRALNREQRVSIALNTGNAGNIQRLLDGEGWTAEQLRPVLDSLVKEEWDAVQAVWDHFEAYRPEIAAKERRVYGKEPDWVEPSPVVTPFGEYRGGYYPIKYDPKRSKEAGEHADAEQAKQMLQSAYTSATTRRSFTKARADQVKGRPLQYSLAGVYNGSTEIIHDLAWHEWLIDVNRLLRSKTIDQAMRDHYGAETVGIFRGAIQDIARGDQPALDVVEAALNHIRTGATIAGLGWNFTTSLLQPLGLTNSMVRIGPEWVGKGITSWLKSPVDKTTEIYEKSSFMRLRGQTMNREISEIQNRVSGRGKLQENIEASMFFTIQKMQLVADIPTWLGQYEKSIASGESESRAVALADQAVIDAQGGGQIKDLSAVQRGGPLRKLFTNFYSYFNVVHNLSADIHGRTDWSNPAEAGVAVRDYLLLYAAPVVLANLLMSAVKGDAADDPEEFARRLAADQLSYFLGTFVLLREVTGMVQKMLGINTFETSYQGPPGLRFFAELDRLSGQIKQGEWDAALRKSSINTAGILFHLPSGQVNKTWSGTEALINGETTNPAAILTGPPQNGR